MRYPGKLKSWNDERGFGFIEVGSASVDVFVHVSEFTGLTGRPQVGMALSFEVEPAPGGKRQAVRVEPLRPSAKAVRRDGARRGAVADAGGHRGAGGMGGSGSGRRAPAWQGPPPEGDDRARRATAASRAGRRRPGEYINALYLLPILLFALYWAVLSRFWPVPRKLWLVYLVMSVVCGIAYAFDKSIAEANGASTGRGRRRVPEKTLHLLALCCGWPGALLAQEFWRHKTAKVQFRAVFWQMVALNWLVVPVIAGAVAGLLPAARDLLSLLID